MARRLRDGRRGRGAFTLVEMLVAMALILFIMVILSEAFVSGLESFRQLKALGDLEERLRGAAAELRRDLAADHFEGRRRLSDPNIFSHRPREGFFEVIQASGTAPAGPVNWVEGKDDVGNPSFRAVDHRLHFSVKLRGNQQDKFFSTVVPAGSALNTLETVYFNQPADGRFQDLGPDNRTYSSPWAEVAYFLVPDPAGARAGSGAELYALYRAQLLVVPDNRQLNWPDPAGRIKGVPLGGGEFDNYLGFSCQVVGSAKVGKLFFNSPTDLAQGVRALRDADLKKTKAQIMDPEMGRSYLALTRRATLLIPDVISFQVQILGGGLELTSINGGLPNPDFSYNVPSFDTTPAPPGDGHLVNATAVTGPVQAIQVSIRVWDPKTEQARQITIVQDM